MSPWARQLRFYVKLHTKQERGKEGNRVSGAVRERLHISSSVFRRKNGIISMNLNWRHLLFIIKHSFQSWRRNFSTMEVHNEPNIYEKVSITLWLRSCISIDSKCICRLCAQCAQSTEEMRRTQCAVTHANTWTHTHTHTWTRDRENRGQSKEKEKIFSGS